MSDEFRTDVIDAFWGATQVRRADVFGADEVGPHGVAENADTVWPGFVGERYRPGGVQDPSPPASRSSGLSPGFEICFRIETTRE